MRFGKIAEPPAIGQSLRWINNALLDRWRLARASRAIQTSLQRLPLRALIKE